MSAERRRGPVRLWLGALLALGLIVAATALWLAEAPPPPTAAAPSPVPRDAETLARGAYLARLGNCAGCHTARGGTPWAGGRAMPTPYGTVYSGNLTPDDETGLGRWSADDFWQALHQGRSRDGRWLAPVSPYTAFTQVPREDSDALYAYLRSLAPVRQATPASGLRFPFNTRAAMALWRALYFRPGEPVRGPDAQRPADWQRGAYLVRGLGHCASCHAPRNALGATREADTLPGGAMPTEPWFAPSLAPVEGVPLAAQQDALIALLKTGQNAHGTAGGPMAEIVVASTQHWRDADLRAAAVYLTSLPAQDPAPDVRAGGPALQAQLERGQALYGNQCEPCHGRQGQGAPGIYPPLAGNPTVTLDDPSNVLQVIRHGGFAPQTAAHPRPFGMPPTDLDRQALADVATYIRRSWGNRAPPVSVLESQRAP